MVRIAVSVLAIAAFACVPTIGLDLPVNPEAASTLIAISSQRGGLPILIAMSSGAEKNITASLPDTGKVSIEALSYPWTLEELQVDEGPIEALSEGRSIPVPSKIFARDVEASVWQERSAISAGFDLVRIATIDPERCVNQGGCFEESERFDHCRIACPGPLARPQPPAAPDPPAIVTATCSDGHRGVVAGGALAPLCFPPKRSQLPCSQGSYQQFGAAACTPISSDCPSEQYAMAPRAATETRLVAPGDDLAAIANGAPEGAALLLSSGIYRSNVRLRNGQTLWGKCPEETTFAASISVSSIDVLIGNLTITASTGRAAVEATPASALRIERAEIEATTRHAVLARQASTLALDRVLIRGNDRWAAWIEGATVTMDDVVMDDMRSIAIHAIGGATVALERVAIRMNAETGDAGLIAVQPGTRVTAHQLSVEDSAGNAVRIGQDASARFERLFISPRVREDGPSALGLAADDAVIEVYGAVIENAGLAGIHLGGASTATIGWAVIRDVQPWHGDPAVGYGIAVAAESRAKIFGAMIERTVAQSVHFDRAALSSVEDSLLRETTVDDLNASGTAVFAYDSEIRLKRVSIEGSGRYAISIYELSSMVGSDLRLRDVARPNPDDEDLNYAAAIRVHRSTAVLRRLAISGTGGDGLSARIATIDAQDLDISDVGHYGINVYEPLSTNIVRAGIRTALAGARFDDTVFVGGVRPRATLEDLSIAGTKSSAVSCGGIGLCVAGSASVIAKTVHIEDSAKSGVHTGQLTQLELSDAEILGGEVGLCFEDRAQDLKSALERVRFEGQPVRMRACAAQTGN